MSNLGAAFASEMDKVIANGNGTDRPEGLFQASGIGSVTSDNGGGGPPTMGDLLDGLFGIGKQYRTSSRCAFVGNDVTYRRARSIAVDTSADQRLLLGLHVDRGSGAATENYSVLGRPYKIQNDLANTTWGFGDLSRYRLYRRRGMSIRWITEGVTLARKNTAVLLLRGTFGGRLTDSSAFIATTNAQS